MSKKAAKYAIPIVHILFIIILIFFRFSYAGNIKLIILQFILLMFSGIAITGGSHRLYTHRSYKARLPLHIFYWIFICLGGWGTPIGWIYYHRTHHEFPESSLDPHNSKKGLWYSHFGWMFKDTPEFDKFVKKRQSILTLEPYLSVHKFINNYFSILILAANIIIPYFCYKLFINSTVPLLGLLCTNIIRFVIILNTTACVNSIAHKYGSRPYTKYIYAYENLFISLLTWGEGWHNYHHLYSRDYRASGHNNPLIYWNPTHAFILLMSKLNLAYDLQVACIDKDTCKYCKNKQRNKTINGAKYHIL